MTWGIHLKKGTLRAAHFLVLRVILLCHVWEIRVFPSIFFFSSVALGLTFWLILVGLTSITGPLLSDTVLGVRNSKIKTTVFGVKKPNLEDSDNGNTV